MERKKLRWAKMGKVEGFIKPVETQMASSLQGLEKGHDFKACAGKNFLE